MDLTESLARVTFLSALERENRMGVLSEQEVEAIYCGHPDEWSDKIWQMALELLPDWSGTLFLANPRIAA